jgi:hypothetical protein
MSSTVKGLRWRLSPVTFQPEPVDGKHPGTFTGQEWRAQEWPICPVCGEQGEPDRVDVREMADQFPVFVMGAWQCVNDCDPREALRGAQ